MDPGDAFVSAASVFKWDPRAPQTTANPCRTIEQPVAAIDRAVHAHESHHAAATAAAAEGGATCSFTRPRELEEVFGGYGVRYATVARIGELGFTTSTLVGMTEAEVDDMMATLAQLFCWDLLLGERYGIKAALRTERRRLHDHSLLVLHHQQQNHRSLVEDEGGDGERRRVLLLSSSSEHHHNNNNAMDALSQEGLSEEPVQQQQQQREHDAAASGGEAATATNTKHRRTPKQKNGSAYENNSTNSRKKQTRAAVSAHEDCGDVDADEDDEHEAWGSGSSGGSSAGGPGSSRGALQRQREHPFIVTEPGEVARAKKNGLDYLFHLYEQCRHFLFQVQAIAKEQGHKCPTKVTNQVFRYAKKIGANYINKPKMRHYVHCYALHCLDEEASNDLRRAFKERGQHVGLWRQACYKPLVDLSARHGWDIDAVFNAHPRLSIWYVPTKLRQLCHLARSNSQATSASSVLAASSDGLSPTAIFPLLVHDRDAKDGGFGM